MTVLAKRLMNLIAILAICGIVVSSESLQHHYATSKTAFCDIGETFNCDIVNRSEYSSILGVPVALVGMLGYAALAGLATVYRARPETPAMLFGGAAVGLAICLVFDLHRSACVGSVVHPVPEFAGADCDNDNFGRGDLEAKMPVPSTRYPDKLAVSVKHILMHNRFSSCHGFQLEN